MKKGTAVVNIAKSQEQYSPHSQADQQNQQLTKTRSSVGDVTRACDYGIIDNVPFRKPSHLCLSFSRSIRNAELCILRFTARSLTLNYSDIARGLLLILTSTPNSPTYIGRSTRLN